MLSSHAAACPMLDSTSLSYSAPRMRIMPCPSEAWASTKSRIPATRSVTRFGFPLLWAMISPANRQSSGDGGATFAASDILATRSKAILRHAPRRVEIIDRRNIVRGKTYSIHPNETSVSQPHVAERFADVASTSIQPPSRMGAAVGSAVEVTPTLPRGRQGHPHRRNAPLSGRALCQFPKCLCLLQPSPCKAKEWTAQIWTLDCGEDIPLSRAQVVNPGDLSRPCKVAKDHVGHLSFLKSEQPCLARPGVFQ